MDSNEATRLAKRGFDNLTAALQAGHSDTLKAYLTALARLHRYSARNVLLILEQRPDATQVAGFATWKKLGRHVRQGEKGIAVLAPMVRRTPVEAPAALEGEDGGVEGMVLARAPPGAAKPASNEGVTATETPAGADAPVVERAVRGFRVAYVYDITQTEGAPLPAFAQEEGDAANLIAALTRVLAEDGITLEYTPLAIGPNGTSRGGAITVMSGLKPAATFSTLVHEYAHEQLHHNKNLPRTRKVMEAEAEAVAYIVTTGLGLHSNNASKDYLHLHKIDADTLQRSLDRIQDTARKILVRLRAG